MTRTTPYTISFLLLLGLFQACRQPDAPAVVPAVLQPELPPVIAQNPVQNGKIIQKETFAGEEGDKGGEFAEDILMKRFLTVFKPIKIQVQFDEKGRVIADEYGTYTYQPGRILVNDSYYINTTDTLLVNASGFVVACRPAKSGIYRPTSRYEYNALNQLMREELDDLYFSNRESVFRVVVQHQYDQNNRTASSYVVSEHGTNQIIYSNRVEYYYNTDLLNSGLPTPEYDAVFYNVSGNMFYNLAKKHPSLYGTLSRNLVERSFFTSQWGTSRYKHEYTMNTKKQVESMYVTRRNDTYVRGFFQRYAYQD